MIFGISSLLSCFRSWYCCYSFPFRANFCKELCVCVCFHSCVFLFYLLSPFNLVQNICNFFVLYLSNSSLLPLGLCQSPSSIILLQTTVLPHLVFSDQQLASCLSLPTLTFDKTILSILYFNISSVSYCCCHCRFLFSPPLSNSNPT